jgi:hypothetical protein
MKEKKLTPPAAHLSPKKMVRIITEVSVNSPTASSNDRYKYRYGYGKGAHNINTGQRVIYRRPSPPIDEKLSQKQSEKQPLLVNDYEHEHDGDGDDYIIHNDNRSTNTINNCFIKVDETVNRINTIVDAHHNTLETQQMREINRKSEKEKEKEKMKEMKEINYKLGRIIYRSRTGDFFEAYHSIHVTVIVVFDKKTRESTTTQTQKVVWNDRIFETKQDWFSEMAKLSAVKADETMKIVRCE